MDPCAGDGAAVLGLLGELVDLKNSPVEVKMYACEMEQSRAEGLKTNAGNIGWWLTKECLHSDAFRVTFSKKDRYGDKGGANLLFLNPPYDTDRVHGRLEQRFLDRFTSALASDGLLVLVVPFYALKASAELLAMEYDDIRCFRFPQADYEAFRQVVLFARKTSTRFGADPEIVARVQAWASDDQSIPELSGAPLYEIRLSEPYKGGMGEWKTRQVDLTALLGKVRPWAHTTRGGALIPVPGIIPDVPVQELLLRTYPVATPPRPAHIAAGIASGLFNGARISANDTTSGFPDLLIKGVFDREYKTIEEKHAKDGSVKAVVQVQQPKLVTTVLDLSTHKYQVLSTGTEETGRTSIAGMNVADLLKYYGDSLMGVMSKQCPVLYDPRRDAASIPLAESPRKMFTAQAHAAKALVKLLGGLNAGRIKRRGKAAILLGEIGSGKSTVALMTGRSIKANRFLIMCPPHLLTSWRNEIAAVLPEATALVLSSVEDLQAAEKVTADSEHPVICILSREVGKLTHAWEGVGKVCPKCGNRTPNVDLAKKRARCEHKKLIAGDLLFQEARRLAVFLQPHAPEEHTICTLLRGHFDHVRSENYAKRKTEGHFSNLDPSFVDTALWLLLDRCEGWNVSEDLGKAIRMLLLATWSVERVAAVARMFLSSERLQEFGRSLLLMLPPGHPEQAAIQAEFPQTNRYTYGHDAWSQFKANVVDLTNNGSVKYPFPVAWRDGMLWVDEVKANSLKAALRAAYFMAHLGQYHWSEECGEELFGAVPEPRRVSLAKHILRYYPKFFDFLILDEGHEYGNSDTAQTIAANRLTSLGIPTILMTGSIMNGYAESLFSNMWALSPDFRTEFERDEKQRFIDRYGYRKRMLEDKNEKGEVIEFGSQSDRVTRSERVVGNAPGLLPLFLLRHLLPISVTLHKTDLAIDLPPCRQQRHVIETDADVKRNYEVLQRALADQIRKDQFEPELAGRLFGQLAELPSYLDRATSDVGNVDSGDFEIRYPEILGSKLVAAQVGLSSDRILPKEEWMLSLVEKELAEGRRVMVFSWHVDLLPRLSRLISERIGEDAPILYADKVATAKRQGWIDREIVKKGRRVMVTNPTCIQTGLNNLVHFSSEVWMESPACNPITYRQAIGRIDRIGQTLETRVHFAVYGDTLQVQLYDLLMKKVAVSVSTDGLDPEAALQAAGLGEDDYLAGLSIGKQLWAMIGGLDMEAAA